MRSRLSLAHRNELPKDAVLYLFYATWCGYCTQFRIGNHDQDENDFPAGSPPATSEWGKVFYYFNQKRPHLGVKVMEINCDTDNPLAAKYGVMGFPTVILDTKNRNHYIYSGPRKHENITDFVLMKLAQQQN